MSPFEALIIYLAAGAPFGVLVFFSQRASKTICFIYALFATVGWPIVGTHRLVRRLVRVQHTQASDRSPAGSRHDQIDLLERLSTEVPTEAAELFAVAGHPNPWLATNCYARARRKVVDSHLDRLVPDDLKSATLQHFTAEPLKRDIEVLTA